MKYYKNSKLYFYRIFILFLASVVFSLLQCEKRVSGIEIAEGDAINQLRNLFITENFWKNNDFDKNGIYDFWAGDISGFFRIYDENNCRRELISLRLAEADLHPLTKREFSLLSASITECPQPFTGYYYRVLNFDENGLPYAQNNYANPSKFAFIAIPQKYGYNSGRTFIINQEGHIYAKNISFKLIVSDEDVPAELLSWPHLDNVSSGWSIVKE